MRNRGKYVKKLLIVFIHLKNVEADLPILHADFNSTVETLDKIHTMRDYVDTALAELEDE